MDKLVTKNSEFIATGKIGAVKLFILTSSQADM